MKRNTMTFTQVRDLFFAEHPQFAHERRARKSQNDYTTDCRVYFCDFVEFLRRDGQITDRQADRLTLG